MAAALARLPDAAKVALVVGGVIAVAAAQTLLRPRRPGHDSFSSEKPESLRPGTRTVDTILAEEAAAAAAAAAAQRVGGGGGAGASK